MKVTEIRYARKFNTGNYESEEYAVTAMVEEDDQASAVFQELKQQITAAHSGEEGTQSEEETPAEDKPTRRRGSKKGEDTDSVEGKAEETDEEENEVEGEEEGDSGNEEEDSEESEDSATEDESEKKPVKKSKRSTGGAEVGEAKPAKKFKKKPQVYQRTNEAHKDIFSSVLKEVAPNWKKDEKSKAKGKSASQKMEGEEFLDENGKVLAAFKQSVKKLMVAKK